jgi:hypothetical protein
MFRMFRQTFTCNPQGYFGGLKLLYTPRSGWWVGEAVIGWNIGEGRYTLKSDRVLVSRLRMLYRNLYSIFSRYLPLTKPAFRYLYSCSYTDMGSHSSPEDGNRSSLRNAAFFTGRWTTPKTPVIQSDIHHGQNRLELAYSSINHGFMNTTAEGKNWQKAFHGKRKFITGFMDRATGPRSEPDESSPQTLMD